MKKRDRNEEKLHLLLKDKAGSKIWNVTLFLSGHIHLRDKVVYNNVTYLRNGAVSGAWLEGHKRKTSPGYGLLDLYAYWRFGEQYVNY